MTLAAREIKRFKKWLEDKREKLPFDLYLLGKFIVLGLYSSHMNRRNPSPLLDARLQKEFELFNRMLAPHRARLL
jgi:hypothetical protein